ncbi:DUF4287 domain-containing protein [Amycolatopsis suaedae]|nr:DUF4287 domain-containing protein [Amycolatopsis suaedae]
MIAASRKPGQAKTGIQRATGLDYGEWFALLDEWGAPGRPFREISAWLRGEHGMSAWWAQKLIVHYEQERGLRPPGARPGGTFTVGTGRTVRVPADRLLAAVADPGGWLPGVALTRRPGRSVRFDLADGTRISVTVEAKDDSRSQVHVEHQLLPDAAAVERRRAFWRERLTELKNRLEKEN